MSQQGETTPPLPIIISTYETKPMLLAITFGPSDDPSIYWNQKKIKIDEESAIEYARKQMTTPGVFGYAVVECDLASYRLVDELGLGPEAQLSQSNGQIRIQHPEWSEGYIGK